MINLETEVLVASKDDNLNQGHDDELEGRRHSEDGAERDEDRGRGEIGVQQTKNRSNDNINQDRHVEIVISQKLLDELYYF